MYRDNPEFSAVSGAAAGYAEKLSQQRAADQCDKVSAPTTVSPLRARLSSDLENLSGQHNRSFRALQILDAHPEFEELIELLGIIRVDIRFRPIQAQRALVTE